MKISQELSNLCSEMKARHRKVLSINRPDVSLKANRVLAAAYALSAASLVIALNQLAGEAKRTVVIDKKAIRLLSARCSGSGLLDKISYNIEQFNDLCSVAMERKPAAMMNRFGAELYNALDDANHRMYVLSKTGKA